MCSQVPVSRRRGGVEGRERVSVSVSVNVSVSVSVSE